MIIGIDIRTLMDKRYSGVPEYTFNLVTELLKQDKKNKYKLFYNSIKDINEAIPKFNYGNSEVVACRYPNKIFNYFLQKGIKYPKIDQLLKVDLFFMPHINFIATSKNVRRVLTIHDLSFLRYPYFFSRKKNLWHRMVNVKKLIKSSDKIIAVSEHTKKDIIDLCGLAENKIKVIYSGVSDEYRPIEGNDDKLIRVKQKYGLGDNFIFFLGTLEPRKNVVGIIDSFNSLKEKNGFEKLELVIAGQKGWKSEKIFKSWRESKYKNQIKFLGYVDSADKIYLYNLAQAFVFPSFYEGFGFPPLEAMACGTPVVTSSSSSLPEAVGNLGIMVDPYNISNITQAVELALTDSNFKNNLREKARERARKFSWTGTVKKYLDLFNEL